MTRAGTVLSASRFETPDLDTRSHEAERRSAD